MASKCGFWADLAQKGPPGSSSEHPGLQFCRNKGLKARKHYKTRGFATLLLSKLKSKSMDGLKMRVLGRFGPKRASRLEF